jgi:hypothetical protein
MVMGSKYGLMDQSMKVNGRMIKLMALENWFMLMVISMKDSGKMIKPTVMVTILMQMVQLITENGKMTNNMEKELKHGLMEQSMRANILKAKSITVVL